MAYAKQRKNGMFTAVYSTAEGKEKSAGTFGTKEQAEREAQRWQDMVRGGKKDDLRKATITIAEFAPMWLKMHPVGPKTKRGYADVLRAHIIKHFGHVRVAELEREAIVTYIAKMIDEGYGVDMQKRVRTMFSLLFQYALDNGYRDDFPVLRIKVQRGSRKKIVVLRPNEFKSVYDCLASDGARALGNLIVSTGCRFGEATALLVSDLDFERGTVSFTKAVQDVGREFHPDGKSRFYVAPFTKTHDHRTVRIPRKAIESLRTYIKGNDLQANDLLFPRDLVSPSKGRERRVNVDLTPELMATMTTFIGPNGKEYRHGTMNGYVTGKCHCDYCKQGFADYRYTYDQAKRERKAAAAAQVRQSYVTVKFDDGDQRVLRLAPERKQRYYDREPYLDTGTWSACWKKALTDAGITVMPTAYQLRHTHASWLINNGEDWKTVMTRLGHKDPSTTSLYVQSVDDDSSSADIMDDLIDWDVA